MPISPLASEQIRCEISDGLEAFKALLIGGDRYKATCLLRAPHLRAGDVVITDDDIDEAIAALTKSKTLVPRTVGTGELETSSQATAAALPESAERTLASIVAMLGWGNMPPRETLEREINALKALARSASSQWHEIETYEPDPAQRNSVLVSDGEFVWEAYYDHDRREWWAENTSHADYCGKALSGITHWQPMIAAAPKVSSRSVATPAEVPRSFPVAGILHTTLVGEDATQSVVVVAETPKHYRVKAPNGKELRLRNGRNGLTLILSGGTHLAPKDAVTFDEEP